jgi:two-component system, NtrC family, response regulator HydG
MTDTTTVPPSSSHSASGSGPASDVLWLVVAWCKEQPHRIGESAVFPDLNLEHMLGRGPGDGRQLRVELAPRRPHERVAATFLDAPSLSREHLLVVPRSIGFEVKLLGRGTMHVAGAPATEGLVAPGQTILLEDRLLLLATHGPAVLETRHLPPGQRGAFGQADRFGMVGESPRLWRLLDMLAFAARSGEHVLLLGETGTGKELAARAVHLLSDRAVRPYVAHNAAGLPPALAEAELFGNVKDYPNPPMPDRAGLLGEASGGSLLLDELGELPEEVQAKLLRVLDDGGQYRRLGEGSSRRADVRVIGATNRPIERFRGDLFARLKQRIELPRLRDRPEDIPLLVQHRLLLLLGRSPDLAARFVVQRPDGFVHARVGVELVDALLGAEHPLNVRGLDAVLLTAIEQSRGNTVRASTEQLAALRPVPQGRRAGLVSAGGRVGELTPAEVDTLRRIIDGRHGCVTAAAKALNLSRYQVYRLMERYGLQALSGEDPDREP